jgi:hypothetical protein
MFRLPEPRSGVSPRISIPGAVAHGAARESKAALDELKASMGTMEFSAQYQQAQVPVEGNLVKRSWFNFYDRLPTPSASGKIIC